KVGHAFNAAYHFLELGLDDFWFPVHPGLSEYPFRFDLSVTLDDANAIVVSNGTAVRGPHAGEWRITSTFADFDIDIAASPSLHILHSEEKGVTVRIASVNLKPGTDSAIAADVLYAAEYLNTLFGRGTPIREVTGVFRPDAETNGRGGYGRQGYFVLP